MKGGVAALSFPDLKQVPIYWLIDREFSSRWMVKAGFELTIWQLSGNFLQHK